MNAEPLIEDKVKAAYHLALLDEPYRKHVCWHGHRDAESRTDAAVAFYTARQPVIIFLLGKPEGVRECLARARLPQFAYWAYFPEHAAVLGNLYDMTRPAEMQRMVLRRDTFRQVRTALRNRRGPAVGELVVLDRRHVNPLEDLYSCEPDFRPDWYQYNAGRYVGVFVDEILATAAGTHFLSKEYSFAMIGNVLTRPGHRRMGLATEAVLGLLDSLFACVEVVCLNVRKRNSAAVKLYESLGFATHCVYHEGALLMKGGSQTAQHGGRKCIPRGVLQRF